MKVVVIGALGNLGSHILNQLNGHGFQTWGLTRENWLLEISSLRNVDLIVHAAGDVKSSVSSNTSKYFNDNLMITMRVLELCKKHGAQRFIFVSSSSVYGYNDHPTEDDDCAPIGIYGLTKLLNERVIAEFCSEHKIQFTCLRVFNIYGGNDKFSFVYRLRNSGLTGEACIVNNNGEAERDFVHVVDVAEIITMLIKLENIPKIINIGTGIPTKVIDLVKAAEVKYPKLNVIGSSVNEIKHSQANIGLLHNTVGHFKFKSVMREFD